MADDISTLLRNNRNKSIFLKLRNNQTIKGSLVDFDVYMNLTLDDAEDVSDGKTQKLGKILLRGDNVLTISLPDDDS